MRAFDTWIANVDRNIGNVLWGAKDKIWFIDHGRCLTGPDWAIDDLIADGSFANKLAQIAKNLLPGSERLQKLISASDAIMRLQSLDIDDARDASRVDGLLPASECDAGFVFVDERRTSVSKKASEALALPHAA